MTTPGASSGRRVRARHRSHRIHARGDGAGSIHVRGDGAGSDGAGSKVCFAQGKTPPRPPFGRLGRI